MRALPLVLLLACGSKDGVVTTADSSPVLVTTGATETTPQAHIAVPEELDFGAVGVGCTKRLNLRVESVGSYPLELWGVELIDDTASVFDVTWEEDTVIAVGQKYDIKVDFRPAEHGSYTGTRVRIRSDDIDDALISTFLIGSTIADPTVVEHFDQVVPPKVDFLLVLDRGGDSEPIIDALAAVLPGALDAWVSAGLDFRVAVVNQTSADAAFLGAVVDAATPSPGQALAASFGAPPVANQKAFEVVNLALTEPLLSGANAGFLRDDAVLSAMSWSSQDDESTTLEPADLRNFLDGLYGGAAGSRFDTISGNGGAFGLPCNFGGLVLGTPVEGGPRLATAASLSGGVHMNICNNTAEQALAGVVESVTGLAGTFELTGPVLDTASIQVSVDGVVVPEDAATGWVFRNNPARIEFAPSAFPPGGAGIDVTYTTAAECI